MYLNIDILFTSYFPNYALYMAKRGIPIFIACWIADNIGMFSNVPDTVNSIEQVFPELMETA